MIGQRPSAQSAEVPGRRTACNLLRSMFDAVDHRNWPALAGFYCPDCHYERPGFPPIQGRAALLYFYETSRPILSGVHRLQVVLEDADILCAMGHFNGVLRTGEPIQLQFADLYELKDRLIHKRKTFFFTPLA
ncbi:MAG: nuclear transport factor 2 family protein [Terriglobia bacterium]